MGHRDSSPELDPNGGAAAAFKSIRDRFPLKRKSTSSSSSSDRQSSSRIRPIQHARFNRKALWYWLNKSRRRAIYLAIISSVFLFAMASMVMQSSSVKFLMFSGSSERGRLLSSRLRFVQQRRFGVERIGSNAGLPRIGIRPPRLAVVSF